MPGVQISRASSFYRWYDRYLTGGVEAFADHRSRPDRVWNRIPEPVRDEIVDLALRETELRVRPGTHDARAMRRIRTMAAAA